MVHSSIGSELNYAVYPTGAFIVRSYRVYSWVYQQDSHEGHFFVFPPSRN